MPFLNLCWVIPLRGALAGSGATVGVGSFVRIGLGGLVGVLGPVGGGVGCVFGALGGAGWGAWCFSDWGSFSSPESIGWIPCQQRA